MVRKIQERRVRKPKPFPGMFTLYARYEPTNDELAEKYGFQHKKDIVLYHDEKCTEQASRYPWHYRSKPNRTSKVVMHNCYWSKLIWLN